MLLIPDKPGREQILLTVDEFEAVRLIDNEKKTHEQCARQMGISRTTVTEMYERARTKIADCLVGGKTLCISGGNYALCDGSAWRCCGKKCDRAKAAAEIESERLKTLAPGSVRNGGKPEGISSNRKNAEREP